MCDICEYKYTAYTDNTMFLRQSVTTQRCTHTTASSRVVCRKVHLFCHERESQIDYGHWYVSDSILFNVDSHPLRNLADSNQMPIILLEDSLVKLFRRRHKSDMSPIPVSAPLCISHFFAYLLYLISISMCASCQWRNKAQKPTESDFALKSVYHSNC